MLRRRSGTDAVAFHSNPRFQRSTTLTQNLPKSMSTWKGNSSIPVSLELEDSTDAENGKVLADDGVGLKWWLICGPYSACALVALDSNVISS